MAKIFLTGASGYIGGEVLYLLAKQHPEYKISALVRGTDKAKQVADAYPGVKVVQGDLDSADIISKEALEADVVLHLAHNKHNPSLQTIHKALTEPWRKTPAFWIQVSGASVLAAAEVADPNWIPGSSSSAYFNDLEGVSEFQSLIRKHPARATDNYILDVDSKQVKTAIVFPPIIHGTGRGPVNQRSIQIPDLVRATLQRKRGFQLGDGQSRWNHVHIADLGELFVRIVEKAAAGDINEKLWNQNGLYLTGTGQVSFGEVSKKVASTAAKKGLIPSDDVEVLDREAYDSLLHYGSIMYGTTACGYARRAKELAGWKPTQYTFEDYFPQVVESEYRIQAAEN